jgi:hypothetical protein
MRHGTRNKARTSADAARTPSRPPRTARARARLAAVGPSTAGDGAASAPPRDSPRDSRTSTVHTWDLLGQKRNKIADATRDAAGGAHGRAATPPLAQSLPAHAGGQRRRRSVAARRCGGAAGSPTARCAVERATQAADGRAHAAGAWLAARAGAHRIRFVRAPNEDERFTGCSGVIASMSGIIDLVVPLRACALRTARVESRDL